MTYHQSQLLGGQVRKGERGTIAIFYKSYTKTVEDAASGEAEDESRRVLKSFTVFNVNQIDGLPERFRPEPVELPEPTARGPCARRVLRRHPRRRPSWREAKPITCRAPTRSRCPTSRRFAPAISIGRRSPMSSRIGPGTSEGSHGAWADGSAATPTPWKNWLPSWASAMVGAELGLSVDHLDDHASYLASWLKVLKADSRAILTAAAKAEEASTYLLGLGRPTIAEPALLAA